MNPEKSQDMRRLEYELEARKVTIVVDILLFGPTNQGQGGDCWDSFRDAYVTKHERRTINGLLSYQAEATSADV
jgi:hypothetical protein